MIDDDDTHDHVVQFKIINVIIVQNQDQHHQSKIKDLKYKIKMSFQRARRNRPSSRDRSPQQQQAVNVVHR